MSTLKLTLKKKWFDMILSGEKTEEYREIKKHWIQRLVSLSFTAKDYKNELEIASLIINNKEHYCQNRMNHFKFVEFTNGYGKFAPKITLEFKGIDIKKPKPEWSEDFDGVVFAIKLGKIVN